MTSLAQPRTICVKCTHHKCTTKDKAQRGIWFNNECRHPALRSDRVIDCVSGEKVWVNSQQYPNYRDINTHGECPHYEAK